MVGDLTAFGVMITGAGLYISGRFLYSALDTYRNHHDIVTKEQLEPEDREFLEASLEEVEEYLDQNTLEVVKKSLGRPEEFGRSWGHIISANELDLYEDKFQYEVPGYGDEKVTELLEPQEI